MNDRELHDLKSAVQILMDEREIRKVIHGFSRGLDRRDRTLIESCMWPDATDVHNNWFTGNRDQLIDEALAFSDGAPVAHFVTNIWIEFVSNVCAEVETYIWGYHDLPPERAMSGVARAGREDMILGGRYLDRFEKRGDEWRIAHRTLVLDFQQYMPSTADWLKGPFSGPNARGSSRPDDPLYQLFETANKP